MKRVPDPKSMAKSLRSKLNQRNIEISHSNALEIVAKQFGLSDWNVLSAQFGEADPKISVLFEPPSPILRIFDEALAREFYVGFLGFNLDWEHRFGDNFPLYCQVSRAGLIFHLSGHHGDANPGSAVHINMKGVSDFHSELSSKDFKYAKPALANQPWGIEMRITDPFNNSLRFCERSV